MSDAKFVSLNNDQIQLIVGDNVITAGVNCDVDKFVQLGNRILSGQVLNTDSDADIGVLTKFIHNFVPIEKQYQIYDARKVLDAESKISLERLVKAAQDVEKEFCLFFNDFSVQELVDFFEEQRRLNITCIINVFGHVLIFNKRMKVCGNCALRRFIYGRYKTYTYANIWDIVPPTSSFTDEFCGRILNYSEGIGSDALLIFNKGDGTTTVSRVIPFPGCSQCFADQSFGGKEFDFSYDRYAVSDNGFRKSDTAHTATRFEGLLNPVGPIVDLEDDQNIDKLALPVMQSEIAINPLHSGFRFHGGKGRTTAQAKYSALGEAMERYNAQYFGYEPLISASYEEMKTRFASVLDPKSLVLDSLYPCSYSDKVTIDWVEGVRFSDKKSIWIPANAVFFVYRPRKSSVQFMPQDTTGLASGLTDLEALLQATLEIIERDSYTIYYRNQLNAPDILLSSIEDAQIGSLIETLSDNHIQVHLKLLVNDLDVYVVHCVTEDLTGDFPIYTHGAGASLSVKVAISRAITECVQLRVSQIKIQQHSDLFKDDQEYQPYFSWGEGNRQDVACFLSNFRGNALSVAMNNCPDLNTGSFLGDLKKIVFSLHKRGLELFAVNLSRPDNPIHAVRAIIPGAQPADDTLRRNSERMAGLPKFLGQNTLKPMFERPLFS